MAAPILAEILRIRRRALAIWGAALGGVTGMYSSMYPSMEKMDLDAMLEAFPPELMEVLGYDDLGSASGYLGSAVFGLVAFALLAVFAIANGSALIAGREEDGALELELTTPVSRSAVYLERLLALWAQITALLVILFVTTGLVVLAIGLDVPIVDMVVATVGLWLLTGLFGSFSFAAGAASGRKGVALGAGAGLAVVGWMLNAIGPTVGYEWMSAVSPVGWYMADNPMTMDFSLLDTALLAGSSLVVVALGRVRFLRRDLMT